MSFFPEAAQSVFFRGRSLSPLSMLRKQLIIQPLQEFERGHKISCERTRSVVSERVHRESWITFDLVFMWWPHTSGQHRVCATIIELTWNVPIFICLYFHGVWKPCGVFRRVRVKRKEQSRALNPPLPTVTVFKQASVWISSMEL